MKTEDLKTLSHLSRALWVDPEYSSMVTSEVLASVSLLNLSSGETVQKVSQVLLNRAHRDGGKQNISGLDHPFFRLTPEERLVLCALHLSHWSYEQLAELLNRTEEEIEQIAWYSRLHLSSYQTSDRSLPSATGSRYQGATCPEYEKDRPWTQRFMDDEVGGQERSFIQNHLMACERCRSALSDCRNLYYVVESMIPGATPDSETETQVRTFAHVWKETQDYLHPLQRGFLTTLKIFFRRKDVKWVCGVGIILFAARVIYLISS